MICPKCQNDTFKARVVRKQRIKEYPHLIPVTLQCANESCSHNIRVYITRDDLNFIRDRLKEILESVDGLKNLKEIWEKYIEIEPEKKKGFFSRLRR